MAIYKISYSKKYKRANIHNYGCNFSCDWCSYKLGLQQKPSHFLDIAQIKNVLIELDLERVHFVGGESTSYTQLTKIADFSKKELGVYTKIGHSNGYNMPPKSIDAISVSIKSLSEDFYTKYVGKSNEPVLENFKRMYDQGVEVDASSVYIPQLVELEEIKRIVRFIADIDPHIPYHITGYIPVPGCPWPAPTWREMMNAKKLSEKYLSQVNVSWFPSYEDYLKMISTHPQYQKVTII